MGRTAETAKMVAELDLKTAKFTKGVSTAVGSLGKLSGAVAKSRAVSVALGVGLERAAESGIRAFAGAVSDGLQSLADVESASTSVTAAINQVGLAGKVTAAQVADWSVEIETAVGSAFDDKVINASAATLIRYGKVTSDNLKPALVVMTDLAAKTGGVDSAASLLAKALADPTKAAGKLSRQGVVLTKTQQDQIKAFVKAGKTAEAQKVILDALSKTTADAAAASEGPYAHSISELRDAYEEATKALAIGFLPVITKVRDILTTELAKPSTLANIKAFGSNLASGFSKLVDFARSLPWAAIGSSLKLAADGAKSILDAFLGLPPWVQTAVVSGWGLNKLSGGFLTDIIGNLGSGLIKGVLGMTAGVVNINAATVNGGGLPGGAVGTAAGGGLLATLGGLAVPVTITAIASKAATDLTNAQFAGAGIKTNFAAPGSTGDNPLLALLPFGTGGAIQSLLEGIRIATDKTSAHTGSIGPDIEHLRGAIIKGIDGLRPKTPKQAAAILKTGALHDKDTSAAIVKLVPKNPVKSSDIETLRGTLAAKLAADETAARNAGQVAAGATRSGSASIVSAIRSSQPIITINNSVSATTVEHKTTVVRRYGPTGGTRNTSSRQNEPFG